MERSRKKEREENVDKYAREKDGKERQKVKRGGREGAGRRREEEAAARPTSTNVADVARVRTQSSPSIGATALTAWAPRNPINKYYNGTPREVGAQRILLSPPPPPPPPAVPRPILAPSYSSSC